MAPLESSYIHLGVHLFSLQCMQESLMMIPECHRRLEKALGELRTMLESEDYTELKESEEYQQAEKVAGEAEEQLKVT